jgi:dipeptidyl aminopeptidase/acylaminoacyl peptidase
VQGLIADGTVDPARICIVGGSYGGYAALVGATLTPDLYACAVSVAGVSDLREILRAARNAGNRAKQYWEKELGVRMRDEALLDEVSPVRGAARVKAPILLIHGKDDAVVPLAQSRAMAKALKDNNKAYELVELEDEDHWLSSGATLT